MEAKPELGFNLDARSKSFLWKLRVFDVEFLKGFSVANFDIIPQTGDNASCRENDRKFAHFNSRKGN